MIMTRRVPYWLSPSEMSELSKLLSNDSLADEHGIIEGIRNEIGVAKLRAENTRIDTNALIVVLGLSEGSLPIHLSDDEVETLKNLHGLSPSIRGKLS